LAVFIFWPVRPGEGNFPDPVVRDAFVYSRLASGSESLVWEIRSSPWFARRVRCLGVGQHSMPDLSLFPDEGAKKKVEAKKRFSGLI
jgi:hypothetical protein